MTDKELSKLIRRFFFALDNFCENGLSPYWLQVMRINRALIEKQLQMDEQEETDKTQMKIW